VAARPAHAEAPQASGPNSAPPLADKPVPVGRTAPGVEPTTLPWHDTYLYWDHQLSANTLGIGQDYQSRDPVYTMTIGLRPRYYFFESPRMSISARADLGVLTERTNSDTTTERGEWSATDFELFGAFDYRLRETREDYTDLLLRLPRLIFPTSKVSYDGGKLLTLGARAAVRESVALEGRGATFFPSIDLVAKVEYGYQFTNSRVPTNSNLERIRLDPEGRSIVSDQLNGATFARHAAAFGASVLLQVHRRVLWTTAFEVRPAWKYPVDHDVMVCGVVLTGCTQPTGVSDPQTRSVLTYFSTDVWFTFTDVLGLTVGYANLTAQLGPDGRRRSLFYSPEATFFATLSVGLDQLYSGLTHGNRQTASSSLAPRRP
jgi:hypothetical protein